MLLEWTGTIRIKRHNARKVMKYVLFRKHARILKCWVMVGVMLGFTIIWKSAHPIGMSYANASHWVQILARWVRVSDVIRGSLGKTV